MIDRPQPRTWVRRKGDAAMNQPAQKERIQCFLGYGPHKKEEFAVELHFGNKTIFGFRTLEMAKLYARDRGWSADQCRFTTTKRTA